MLTINGQPSEMTIENSRFLGQGGYFRLISRMIYNTSTSARTVNTVSIIASPPFGRGPAAYRMYATALLMEMLHIMANIVNIKVIKRMRVRVTAIRILRTGSKVRRTMNAPYMRESIARRAEASRPTT